MKRIIENLVGLCALLLFSATALAQTATDVKCNGCVQSGDIATNGVRRVDIQNFAVNTPKINNFAVTTQKLGPGAVTTGKIADGAVTSGKVSAELAAAGAAVGIFCIPGEAMVGINLDGSIACERFKPRVAPATCAELAFTGQVWGTPVTGFDLRERTNSTLHYLGDLGTNFTCDDSVPGQLSFSTTSVMRTLVDAGDQNGDTMDGPLVCCSSANPDGVCNSPDQQTDVDALCRALGFNVGTFTQQTDNSCPEVESAGDDGASWRSDFVASSGWGNNYVCTF